MKPHGAVFAVLLLGCASEVLPESFAAEPTIAHAERAKLAEGHDMPRTIAVGRLPSTAPAPLPLVLFLGNSLTLGQNATLPYPGQTMALLAATTPFQNLGHNSETTVQMSAEAPTLVDVQYNASAPPIVIAWEGTNDLFRGASAVDAFQHLADYCANRRAVGFPVVVVSVLPLVNGSVPDFNARRSETNAMLRAHWGEFADRYADVGNAAELQDPSDRTVFASDAIHLTDQGYAVVARVVAAELASLR